MYVCSYNVFTGKLTLDVDTKYLHNYHVDTVNLYSIR